MQNSDWQSKYLVSLFFLLEKKVGSLNVVSDLLNGRSFTLMRGGKNEVGGGCCRTFPALFIYFPSILEPPLCSHFTGNANRWVTISAERARSDFGFEMLRGSPSLSTEENCEQLLPQQRAK